MPNMNNEPPSQAQWDTIQRDNVARLNRNEMTKLMREHGIVIRAAEFPNWRPTLRVEGQISGVSDGLTIIMTNGLLAYFLRQRRNAEGDEVFIGHIQCFSEEVKPLFSTNKSESISKPKVRKKRKTTIEKAMEFLTAACGGR